MPIGNGFTDKTEIKIFILFLLDEICYPLDDVTIGRIVQENGYVEMFPFAECFSELVEQGLISEDEMNGVHYYSIAENGHMVAVELQDSLTEPIRRKSSQSAARILSLYKRKAKLFSKIEPAENGRYRVLVSITEKGIELFHTTLLVSSEAQAKQIKEHFRLHPEEVYRGIFTVLTGEMGYLLN